MLPIRGSLWISVAAILFVAASGALAAPCDATYVKVDHKMITVAPNGADDTANLQCAFDLAATMGPSVTVQLAAGTFTTAQLVVEGVKGSIRGMGQDVTVIHNPSYPMTIDRPYCNTGEGPCFADSPPSADNRYPSLITVLGEDVLISNLQIEIIGKQAVTLWRMWDGPFGFELLSNVMEMMGSHSSLKLHEVTILSGGYSLDLENMVFIGQAAGPFNMWSASRPWFVTGSSLEIADSTFRGGAGAYLYNLDHSRAFIKGNRFELIDYAAGVAISDVRDSHIQVSHNEIVALGAGVLGTIMWPGNIGTGIASSWLLFDNNIFSGSNAMLIQSGTFHDGVQCQAVNNDIGQITGDPYILNGNPCKIVGSGPPIQ